MSKYRIYQTGSQWAVESLRNGSVRTFETMSSARTFVRVMGDADESIMKMAIFCRGEHTFGQIELSELSWDTISSWLKTGVTLKIEDVAYGKDDSEDLRSIWLNEKRKASNNG